MKFKMRSSEIGKGLELCCGARRLFSILASATLAVLICASVFAEKPAQRQESAKRTHEQSVERDAKSNPTEEIGEEETLRIDTDMVLIEALVTDATGEPVRNLKPEDFKLYEDGEERPLAFFNVARRNGEERPAAVVFLIDVSGSMTAEEMERVRAAMREFARGMAGRPASFSLMSFGMSAKVRQGFTKDFTKITRSLARLSPEADGLSTHTYDAVDDAVRLLVRQAPRTIERKPVRRAVVVVTDGFPVGDTVSPQTVIERANEAGVSVYTVTLPSYSRAIASASAAPLPTPLDVSGLAEKTGGASIYANQSDYGPLFKALAEEVVSTYLLAFYPPEEKRRDGRFHALRVEVPRGLNVRQSRDGYRSGDKR